MAIGDDAIAAGYDTVPDTGEENARVRWGAREINRTRDYVAEVSNRVPTTKAGFRAAGGQGQGTAMPSGGNDGDTYLRILP